MTPFHQITNPSNVELDVIETELTAGKKIVAQFDSKPYDEHTLSRLNELCKKYPQTLAVRFYDHYSDPFDCRTVLRIPDVRSLFVDCLSEAKNVYALTELRHLRKLSLGVFQLTETELLESENFRQLTELTITETKTKAFNLGHLRHFGHLKSLIIGGYSRNIGAIGELTALEHLCLSSLKKTPVPFVNNLKKLKTLRFLLGGRDNIEEIEENRIENLEIGWVRGFNNLANISNFKCIRTLRIADEIQLSKLSFDAELPFLTDLKILNCKTLHSIDGLSNLPQLNSVIVSGTNIDFDRFIQQQLPNALRTLNFYTTKAKEDRRIKEIITHKGYLCR